MRITHGECGKSWSGSGRAHCSGCHETFSTYGVSDRHRVGRIGVDRRCADPASVGLILGDNGIWHGEPRVFSAPTGDGVWLTGPCDEEDLGKEWRRA